MGLFKLRHPKIGTDIFSDFLYFKNLREFSLQEQQGHFHLLIGGFFCMYSGRGKFMPHHLYKLF
jgi:hypothetical protein